MTKTSPRQLETHFAFGDNWSDYARTITPAVMDQACRDLGRLIPPEDIEGRRFLDIGCGSGLASLAALRAGAREVLALDLDPASVATARRLLAAEAPEAAWSAREVSVFDLDPEAEGRFDIVYSWGVLHHTGDMWAALERAARMVAPGGLMAVALYRRTPLCGLWTLEKRLYARAPAWLQAAIRVPYKLAFCLGLLASGRSPTGFIRDYAGKRGMSWHHDVHDWLGGYPYDSTTPEETSRKVAGFGFVQVRCFTRPPVALGLFGSHCDEFVFRRPE